MGGPAVPRVTAQAIAAAGSVTKLIVSLIEVLRASSQMELVEKAAAALRSLAIQGRQADESMDNSEIITSSGGLPPMVLLLNTGSTVAQTHVCSTIALVTRSSTEHQLAVGRLGGLGFLVAILKAGGNSAQEQAAAAVASLSQAAANQAPLIKAGAIPPLVNLLKAGSSEAQLGASEALGNLVASSPDAQLTVLRAGGVKRILALLGSGKAQEFAARAIAKLAHENLAVQTEVCKEGGVALLLALLSGINVEAQTQAAVALDRKSVV